MSALERIHREDDLEFHPHVVKLGPSRYDAHFRVFRRVAGALRPTMLVPRRHAVSVECASAVTADTLALRAARKAAYDAIGREAPSAHALPEPSWVDRARLGRTGTAFRPAIPHG